MLSPGRSKATRHAFWLVRGSQGRSYFTSSDGCSCPGYRHRGVCSHQIACTMRQAREAAQRPASHLPVVRDRYSVLFPEVD